MNKQNNIKSSQNQLKKNAKNRVNSKVNKNYHSNKSANKSMTAKEREQFYDMMQIEWVPFDPYCD